MKEEYDLDISDPKAEAFFFRVIVPLSGKQRFHNLVSQSLSILLDDNGDKFNRLKALRPFKGKDSLFDESGIENPETRLLTQLLHRVECITNSQRGILGPLCQQLAGLVNPPELEFVILPGPTGSIQAKEDDSVDVDATAVAKAQVDDGEAARRELTGSAQAHGHKLIKFDDQAPVAHPDSQALNNPIVNALYLIYKAYQASAHGLKHCALNRLNKSLGGILGDFITPSLFHGKETALEIKQKIQYDLTLRDACQQTVEPGQGTAFCPIASLETIRTKLEKTQTGNTSLKKHLAKALENVASRSQFIQILTDHFFKIPSKKTKGSAQWWHAVRKAIYDASGGFLGPLVGIHRAHPVTYSELTNNIHQNTEVVRYRSYEAIRAMLLFSIKPLLTLDLPTACKLLHTIFVNDAYSGNTAALISTAQYYPHQSQHGFAWLTSLLRFNGDAFVLSDVVNIDGAVFENRILRGHPRHSTEQQSINFVVKTRQMHLHSLCVTPTLQNLHACIYHLRLIYDGLLTCVINVEPYEGQLPSISAIRALLQLELEFEEQQRTAAPQAQGAAAAHEEAEEAFLDSDGEFKTDLPEATFGERKNIFQRVGTLFKQFRGNSEESTRLIPVPAEGPSYGGY